MFFRRVNLPFYIARRYLVSKKSHNAINIISGIGVLGVVLSTVALVCTLAVFSGFKDLVATLFTEFDPQIEIVPAGGKFMRADAEALAAVRADEWVEAASETMSENALVMYGGRQMMVTLRGVDDEFTKVSGIERTLYGDGAYMLHADVLDYAIPGLQVAAMLGTGVRFGGALQVYAPRRGERINAVNPAESFTGDELYSPGVVFSVNQSKYDANYIIVPLRFVRRLYERQGEISSLQIKLRPGVSEAAAKERFEQMLGADYKVYDRYMQHEEAFRTMQIEKFVAFLFLTFILLIACFNIVGSLSMLILDKRDDVATLRSLGANDAQVRRIFLFEGRLIVAVGALAGIAIGLALCYGQMQFGWLRLGSAEGNFIVDAYPVSVRATDVLLVLATVVGVGWLFVMYPVSYLTKRLLR